jgi:ankyrin repeat protein
MKKNRVNALRILFSAALLVSTVEQSSSESEESYHRKVSDRRSELWRADSKAFYNAKYWGPELYEAIELKDVDKVQDIIDRGADISALCRYGLDNPRGTRTPCRYGDFQNGIAYWSAGVYAGNYREGRYGVGPLHLAAYLGDMQMLALLIDNGVDVNSLDFYGRTALYYAIFFQNKDMIEFLIDKGAKIYLVDTMLGDTPLGFAGRCCPENGDINNLLMDKSIEAFLSSEKDPIWFSESYHGLLYNAVRLKRMEFVETMIDKNPSDINAHFCSGDTLWHLAVKSKDKGLAEFLRNKNANVNERGSMRYTPLHVAVMNKDVEMVRLLLAVDNIDVNCGDNLMSTLCYAVRRGYTEIVELLLGNEGMDPDAEDSDGNSALHLAVESRNVEIVRLLVNSKATIDKINRRRETPLLLATQSGNSEMVRLLVGAGANPRLQRGRELSPVEFANYYANRFGHYDRRYRDIADSFANLDSDVVPEAEERTAPVTDVPVQDTRSIFTRIADFFRRRSNVVPEAEERTAPVADVPVRDTRSIFTRIADFFRNWRSDGARAAD